MNMIGDFFVYDIVFKWLLYWCLFHLVWVHSYKIPFLYNGASRDLVEKLSRLEKPVAHDSGETGERRVDLRRSLYERKFGSQLASSEENNKQWSYKHEISQEKFAPGRLPLFTEELAARSRKPSVMDHTKNTQDLVSFRNFDREDKPNSYAVKQPRKEKATGSIWNVTTVSAIVILIVITALCLHVPCPFLWRRQRSGFHGIGCPNPAAHHGMCGKCIYHSDSSTVRMRYEEKANQSRVSMAGNHGCFPSGSKRYSSQYTWMQESQPSNKLNQTKEKVSSLFKSSRGTEGYRYKPLRNTEKRLQHTTYEPEWTSIGAFLNDNRKSSFSRSSYGSTNESEKKFVDRFGRRSRDSVELCPELVEYSLKLRPKKRQVIELKEFPPGYSKTYLNIDLESDPSVVYDPYREQLHRRTWTSGRFTQSDSNLRDLSCIDRPEHFDSGSLFNVGKPRKSSLKLKFGGKSKSNSKVVHFFPSNFSYDAQFVQVPAKNETMQTKEESLKPKGHGENIYNVGEVREDFKKAAMYGNNGYERPTKLSVKSTTEKEHAVDWYLQSPSTEAIANHSPGKQSRDLQSSSSKTMSCSGLAKQSHDRGGTFLSHALSYSEGALPDVRETIVPTKDTSFPKPNLGVKQNLAKSFETLSSGYTDLHLGLKLGHKMSSSFTDLHDRELLDYKPEPLAGLLSPKRNVSRAHVRNVGMSQTAAVSTINQDSLSIGWIQRDDTATFKFSQSEVVQDGNLCSYVTEYSETHQQNVEKDECYPVKENCTILGNQGKAISLGSKANNFQEIF